jgi:hypothetical protein
MAGFPATLSKLKEQLVADSGNIVAEIDLGSRLAKKGVKIPGGLAAGFTPLAQFP